MADLSDADLALADERWDDAIALTISAAGRAEAIGAKPYLARARSMMGTALGGVAYGEAQDLDPGWLADVQKFLPRPDLTLVLDIAPQTAVERKSVGRDRYERDLALLERVRASYRRQAHQPGWLMLDGERPITEVAEEIAARVVPRLAPR